MDMQQDNQKQSDYHNKHGEGMALGLMIGLLLGLLILPGHAGFWMVIGIAVGAAYDKQRADEYDNRADL